MRAIELGGVTILFVLFFAAVVAEPVVAKPRAVAAVNSVSVNEAHLQSSHPHAAHGKRSGHSHGVPAFRQLRQPRAVLVYDSELGVHVVLGSRHLYYIGGRYFRSRFGAWDASTDLLHWVPVKHRKVPFELRKQVALRTK